MTELFLSEEDLTNEISKYIFTSKYARYIPELKRRETWNESVDRVRNMHLSRFSYLDEKDLEEIRWAFSKVAEKEVIPSMRSMQFGGKAQEVAHARGYNCCMLHINSVRSFAEVFYLLLCGCGVGISLTQEFFNRLPDLVGPQDKTGTVLLYTIEDSIEGWSDSVEVLLSCYMRGTPFSGRRIVFDYSKIRPAGAPLKTSGGKAPGYVGLKNAHMKIKALLDHIIEDLELTRMRTIDAYDILCHSSDAVLSGGVRRSAMMVLFDKDDKEMLASKVGDWTDRNPQRARSNNSVIIPPNSMTFEEFSDIFERTRQWGEPGFAFIPQNAVTNPCQPASAPILTKNGLRTMGDIEIGDEIWSETGWTTVVKKWSTGIKPVFKYSTTAGYFLGTENHRIVSNGSKIEVGKAASIDRLAGPTNHVGDLNPDDIMAGLLIGDGSRNHPTGIQTILYIGDNDSDYFDSEISNLIVEPVSYIKKGFKVKSDIEPEELIKIEERSIPARYLYCDSRKARGFLRGLYSANGSVAGNRITLKTASKILREQVQLLLSSLGIRSYFTTNKSNDVTFFNGTYTCKESYDINITSDRFLFMEYIGFIQEYKNKKVVETPVRSRKNNYDIVNVEFIREEEVFDITVDNDPHTYWTGGLNVSNCAEITTIPVTKDGVCGVQFCVAGDTPIITKDGISNIESLVGKETEVWNGKKWSKVNPYQTGSADELYRVRFSDGSFLDVTDGHKFLVKTNYWKEYREFTTLEIINWMKTKKANLFIPRPDINQWSTGEHSEFAYEYGFFKGDGHFDHGVPKVNLFKGDWGLSLRGISMGMFKNWNNTPFETLKMTDLKPEFCQDLKMSLPDSIFSWDRDSVMEFLGGWIDADGSKANNGCRLYGDEDSIRRGQLLLTKFGINSSINLMQSAGTITNLGIRKNDVWYLQIPDARAIKSRRLDLSMGKPPFAKGKNQIIRSVEKLNGLHASYCLTELELNQCLFGNALTKQCNLSSINGAKVHNEEDFYEAAKAAAIIGTLQASYTDFPYLSKSSEEITREESLLGVSITGVFENEAILLSPLHQEIAAQIAVETNERWAEKLGINPAARITCIKPEGTSSIVYGTMASGIHPAHDRFMIRRVQANKNDNVYKFFKTYNPHMCEESVWSANKTDDVISFPIKVSDDARIKAHLSAKEHLDIIKSTQEHWVKPGGKNNKKPIHHSVSCTVLVKDEEWDDVARYLYDNQDSFTCVSLLPAMGDKKYAQAPMESVQTDEEFIRFEELAHKMMQLDYTLMVEDDDETNQSAEMACAGGACEIVYS